MADVLKRIKNYLPYVFIVAFISLYLYQNHVFIQRDNYLPFSDAPGHLAKAAGFLNIDKIEFHYVVRRDPFPPLTYWIGFIFLKILGPSVDAAQYSLFIFVIIFLLSLYGIGYEYGGHYSGAAVMAMGGSSPHIINYSRWFFIDFPQAAMTALVFYVLLKTNNYRNRFFSVLLGIVFCLGFLTKWSVTFFLFLPLVWFVLPHIVKTLRAFLLSVLFGGFVGFLMMRLRFFIDFGREFSEKEVFRIYLFNFFLPTIIFISVIGLWVHKKERNWDEINVESVKGVFNAIITGLIIMSVPVIWLLWTTKQVFEKIQLQNETIGISKFEMLEYVKVLTNAYSFFSVFAILGLVLIFILQKRGNFKPDMTGWFNRLILPVNLILSVWWVSYMGPYDTRYILASCIFAAALGGWWIGWLGKVRLPVIIVIVILSIISMAGWLFIPQNSGILQVIYPDPSPCRNNLEKRLFPLKPLTAIYPSGDKFDLRPVLEYLKKEESKKQKKILWIRETGTEPISFEYVRFLTLSHKLNFDIIDKSPDGSNREILRNNGIEIITCYHEIFAENEIEEIKKLHAGGKIKVKRLEYPGNTYLYLIKIEKS